MSAPVEVVAAVGIAPDPWTDDIDLPAEPHLFGDALPGARNQSFHSGTT